MVFTSKMISSAQSESYGLIEAAEITAGSLSGSGTQNLYLTYDDKQALIIGIFSTTLEDAASYCIWFADNNYKLLSSAGILNSNVVSCNYSGYNIAISYRLGTYYSGDGVAAIMYRYLDDGMSLSKMSILSETDVSISYNTNISHNLNNETKLIIIFGINSSSTNNIPIIPMLMMKNDDNFIEIDDSQLTAGDYNKISSSFNSINVDSSNKLNIEASYFTRIRTFTIVELG